MSTYNLARMNMFLHDVAAENQNLHHGDTLDADWPTGEETDFHMVLMNPPYSAKWSAASGFLQDERFSEYGVWRQNQRLIMHFYFMDFII